MKPSIAHFPLVLPPMNDRAHLIVTANIRPIIAIVLAMLLQHCAYAQTADVWFGTAKVKRDGLAKGIYHATQNLSDGSLSQAKLAIKIEAPGFLAFNPAPALKQSVIYATTQIDGQHAIASLRADENKKLTLMNSVATGPKARAACHVAVDATGKIAVSCQYGSGTVSVFRLAEDGTLTERTQLIKHVGGSKVYKRRQHSPHAHYCGFDPANRFAFVCDLGLDRVKIYKIDFEKSILLEHGEGVCVPGGGPRHLKFHPGGKHVFVLNELAMSLSVFRYDADNGSMKLTQTVKTIADSARDQEVFNSASEVVVHPSGQFVYSGNRGNDTVSVFAFDESAGTLERIQVEPIRGSWPRNFNLSPDGKWLIAAGGDSNTAAPFRIDQQTGRLTFLRGSIFVPHPICVLFTGGQP